MRDDSTFLSRLLEYCPPPTSPRFSEDRGDWPAIQESFGLWLPDFIPEFGRLYGTGQFQDDSTNFVRIFNPHDPTYRTSILEVASNFELVYGDDVNFPFRGYSPVGGLFPIGDARGGESLYCLIDPVGKKYQIVRDERSAMHDPSGHHLIPGLGFFEFLLLFLHNGVQDFDFFEQKPHFVRGWGS